MKIQENSFVAIDYTLTLDSGEEMDKSEPGKPLGFLIGCGQIIPGLEKALMGQEQGYEAKVVVEPEDGYGPNNPELIREISKDSFPPDVKLEAGMVFQTEGPHGPIIVRIVEVKDDCAVADLNHPLAGKQLNFDIKVVEVREASEDELAALKQAMEHACSHDSCQGCGEH